MRKILLNVVITLDGFIEGPDGEYDWCFTDQDYDMQSFIERTDTILFGRKSYELLLQTDKNAWPNHARIVFSKTQNSIEGASIIYNNIEDHIYQLKHQPGKDIWLFGGASLTDALLGHGLIDELHLSIHPILLGKGKLLFGDALQKKPMALLSSKSFSTGLVQVIYGLSSV